MIEKFLKGGDTPKLRVMFVDEAQDLSLIQWKLVRRIEEASTDKIGYFTFSKNAAEEGKQRAASKFKLSFDDLPYFQTLHSFCFNQLGLARDQVMKEKHYKELG